MLNMELEITVLVSPEAKQAINQIEKVLAAAAEIEALPDVSVAVTIVDNERIQEVNKVYRQKDMSTDVLSFPLFAHREEMAKEDWEETIELGDILISLPTAEEQAKEYGHSLLREISFLAVHGFLHLIGYDHETKEEEEVMFSRQEEVLSKLGINR